MTYRIFQIYYDGLSRAQLDPGFIPLNNVNSERPDWFEFHPMLSYLNQNKLEDDVWYGFLSPKFKEKTGYTSSFVKSVLEKNPQADVALFSHSWDQIAYFKNPWEQGEYFHPGLIESTQTFLDEINLNLDIKNLITDNSNTVYSNFIIAKKKYWYGWKLMANQLYEFSEGHPLSVGLKDATKYGSTTRRYEMKVFVQERLPTLILHQNKFKTVIASNSKIIPIFKKLFKDNNRNIRLIEICGELKNMYRNTQDVNLLNAYWHLRKSIEINT